MNLRKEEEEKEKETTMKGEQEETEMHGEETKTSPNTQQFVRLLLSYRHARCFLALFREIRKVHVRSSRGMRVTCFKNDLLNRMSTYSLFFVGHNPPTLRGRLNCLMN